MLEQAPLVARSVTPPSPPTSPSEMMERGDDTARSTLWGPSAACTSILYRVCRMTPPDEHTSEGGRDDRGVPLFRPRSPTQVQTLRALRVWGWHAMTRRLLGRFHPSWTGEWPLASPCCPDPRRSGQRFLCPRDFGRLFTAYWGTQTKTKKPRELTSSNFIARPRNSPTPTSPTR